MYQVMENIMIKVCYIMKFDEKTLEMKRIQQIETQDYPSYMICNDHDFICRL